MNKKIQLTALCAVVSILAFAQIPVSVYEDCQRMGGTHDLRPKADSADNAPDGAKWVDLGLPSGLLWANMNLGATSITKVGDTYAWGEVVPKKESSTATYKYMMGSNVRITKYNTIATFGEEGFVDNKRFLDLEDDAAHVIWGGKWFIPSQENVQELITNCTYKETNQNGIFGVQFISKINGQVLFMPYDQSTGGSTTTYYSYCWTSEINSQNPSCAKLFRCYRATGTSAFIVDIIQASRPLVYHIRPVRYR